jgi:tripartite-type tricarboxylate transporter receptor subunit TctC
MKVHDVNLVCSSWRKMALAIFLTVISGPASAQNYPSRSVTLVLPFAAGSVTDSTARVIAKYLQSELGQPFVIENKPGAGAMLAAQSVANAKPDGYTLLLTTSSSHSAAPAWFKSVPYDPIKDFTPIARIGTFSAVIVVNPQLPFNSMAELIADAHANPGKLLYGYGNSTGRIIGETLKRRTGVDIASVPYRSDPAGNTDLIAGHIQIMIPSLNSVQGQIAAKLMRPLAVADAVRNRSLPDVPTLSETVTPGFSLVAWAGLFGPANMAPEVVNILANKIRQALSRPEINESFASSGIAPFWGDPIIFKEYVEDSLLKWTTLIREAGIQPE